MIAEIGNHESLLIDHPRGLYANLVRTQEDADDQIAEAINESDLEMDDIDLDIEEHDPQSAFNANTSTYEINRQHRKTHQSHKKE